MYYYHYFLHQATTKLNTLEKENIIKNIDVKESWIIYTQCDDPKFWEATKTAHEYKVKLKLHNKS